MGLPVNSISMATWKEDIKSEQEELDGLFLKGSFPDRYMSEKTDL